MENTALFEEFNEAFNMEDLKRDIEKANNNERVEVPHGNYEVSIGKIELTESKNHQPMTKIWFKVVAGEYKGQMIFMNQMVNSGFGIHNMCDFLESLKTDIYVSFEDYVQFNNLCKSVFAAIDGTCEFQLEYVENERNPNFSTYKIVKRFEV